MKLSTLLEVIGSGSMLLMAGVIAFTFGLAICVADAVHIPLWVSLCGFGALVAIVGILLIDHGSEVAEERVKFVPPMIDEIQDTLRSPWLKVGVAILGGIVLSQLFRRRPTIIIEQAPNPPMPIRRAEPVERTFTAPPREKDSFSVSKVVGDELRSLASLATGMALSLGVKALGIPSAEQLLDELLGTSKPKTQAKPQPTTPSGVRTDATQRVPAAAHSAASEPSHNGRSAYSDDIDPNVY